jgi:hypothetical protein
MSDNVIQFESAKSGTIAKSSEQMQATPEELNNYNKEHIDGLIKSVDTGAIKSLVSIALNTDGSIDWTVSGSSSNFEIIAALESTKFDFLNS